MKKETEVSIVFQRNREATTRIVVNQGGSRSGKTYSILQLLILDKALQTTGATFTIARKGLPSLKGSAMRDFFEILENAGLYDRRYHNKSDNTYMLNGNLFEFISMDDSQKKRGSKRSYLFLNEANELEWDDWAQLSMRTEKQIFLDFNPSMTEHWIYDRIIPRPDCTLITSTFLDNLEFLPQSMVNEILSYKDTDSYYWQVYGLGLPCDVTGLVFPLWNLVDSFPDDCKWVTYGLDFGFSNDPTALVKVGLYEGMLFLDELIYSRSMTSEDIANAMLSAGLSWYDEVIADNQPKTIAELRKFQLNVKPTFKGKDSILAGIDAMKLYKLNVTKSSLNVIKELKNYKWKDDPSGKPSNVPVDKFNHAMDAVRYAVLSRQAFKRRIKVRSISLFDSD